MKADLVVIGGGSGGLSVAAGAAMLGVKTVLFERGEMGGDCLNTGCVPSKALIAAGKRAHAFRTADVYGLGNVEPTIDWLKVKAHVHGVIAAIAPIDSQERFEGLGVHVVREHARFSGPATVESPSVRVTARRIVVAAGGGPAVPPIPGLADVPFLTNESIFELNERPSHLLVLGGGPIGLELAQAFRRLGSAVTVIEANACLGRDDPEAASVVVGSLKADGVEIREGWKAVSAAPAPGGVTLEVQNQSGATDKISGSHLLVALGRKVNVDGLDLDKANVAYTQAGVTLKPTLQSVSNPRVWAVGDIAGLQKFTHTAGWHASVFVRNGLFKRSADASASPMPHATYTEPELAQVGLTEAQAREQFGDKVTITHWKFHENDRAIAERANHGFGKLVIGKGGKILGATIVGEGAGDLIQLPTMAMANGLGVIAFTKYIAPYPTRGELIKKLASLYYSPFVFGPRMRFLVSVLQRF
jgi:pyruvate/2-oxoglutarate dehydrogenase complex dihydrolipoamide dehydrogenase (E3) component